MPPGVIFLTVKDPRRMLALIAQRFHPASPARSSRVTGTAGKSSVADFTRQIFIACGHRAASIGTIGIVTDKGAEYGSLTTPDPVTLHETLDRLAADGITPSRWRRPPWHRPAAARWVKLAAAAFTNLGRDHLDYHPTMEAYLEAKLRLFETLLAPGQPAIIMRMATLADVIAACFKRGQQVFSVGRNGLDIKLIDNQRRNFMQTITIEHEGRKHRLVLPLTGDFQVENARFQAACGRVGCAIKDVVSAMRGLVGVKGRMELVGRLGKAPVFVDYAHKPEGAAACAGDAPPYSLASSSSSSAAAATATRASAPSWAASRPAMRHRDRHRRQSAQRRASGDPRRHLAAAPVRSRSATVAEAIRSAIAASTRAMR